MDSMTSGMDALLAEYDYAFVEAVAVGRLYSHQTLPAILIDSTLYNLSIDTFQYVDYTSYQNKLMHQYNGLYRFSADNIQQLREDLSLLFSDDIDGLDLKKFGADRQEAHIDPSPPEYRFAQLFEEVFGSKSIYALQAEALYIDRRGHRRYIDYVLQKKDQAIAIELNGEQYHHPLSAIVSKKQYRSQLFKQNSLVHDGYLVYRWSNRGMSDAFKFEDQLVHYFGNAESFINAPNYRSERSLNFSLYEHQEDAVNNLQAKRSQGNDSFLVVLPTGTGKTEVFIEDFRTQFNLGLAKRTLAIVPTRALKKQLTERIQKRLTQVTAGEQLSDSSLDVCIQTSAYLLRHYRTLPSEYFDYILVDEAHRAAADGLSQVLAHFKPKSLLGLTATDQRLDQRKLEDIFGHYEVELSLEDAIKQKLVPQIRAFRLESNLDLSAIRFNGKDYVKSDLQKTVLIPSRDQLIVDTLLKYFYNERAGALNQKQGVVFCVDVKHTKRLAKLFQQHGIKAAAVSANDRAGIEQYHQGDIQIICACDLLNEGWDAPQTNIVVMARPTMSKVLYTQQLGRGTRNHHDKEALYVIDVVDSYAAALQPWSVHSLFNFGQYQPFGNLVHEVDDIAFPSSELITLDGLYETERRVEPINIFNFEKEFGDLLNEEQFARELFVSTATIKSWVKKGELQALKTLPFGNKALNYFSLQQLGDIREAKNIPIRTKESRKDDFFEFLEKRDYTFSYKIIFMLIMVNHCNKQGELSMDRLGELYANFYRQLLKRVNQAEKNKNPLNQETNLDNSAYIKRNILSNPFEKFERKRFFYQCNDLNLISFDTVLWEKLQDSDLVTIHQQMLEDAKAYYAKIDITLLDHDFSALEFSLDLQSTDTLANKALVPSSVSPIVTNKESGHEATEIPYYQDLKIACGHFKASSHEQLETIALPASYGNLDSQKHFVASAKGDSMNGGKQAIVDGDLLLLEWINSNSAGSISNQVLAIELLDETGDPQYLLRKVLKQGPGQYQLKANNPSYTDMPANEQMNTFARLKAVIDPKDLL